MDRFLIYRSSHGSSGIESKDKSVWLEKMWMLDGWKSLGMDSLFKTKKNIEKPVIATSFQKNVAVL